MTRKKNLGKLLALVGAFALLGTMFSGLISVRAAAYTEVKTPSYATYDGSIGTPATVTPGSAMPAGTVQDVWGHTAAATAAANAGIGDVPAYTASCGGLWASFEGVTGGAGLMLYVKAPGNDQTTRLALYLVKNGTAALYQYGDKDWYLLPKGNTSWTPNLITAYGPELPAGFEGYVYIPYEAVTNPAPLATADALTGYQLEFGGGNMAETFTVGAPVVVMPDGLDANSLPTTGRVVLGGKAVPLYKENTVTIPSAPVETPAHTVVIPPEYMSYSSGGTGTPVTVEAGSAMPSTVVTTGSAAAVESPMPFTSVPILSAKGNINVTIKGAAGGAGVMMYVKAPDSVPETRLAVYLNKNAHTDQYQYGYKDWYLLPKNSTVWNAETITQYGPKLPAGFEGYLYIPYDSITLTGSGVDQPVTDSDMITGMRVWFGDEGDALYQMSAPIIVTPYGLTSQGLPTADQIIVGETTHRLFPAGGDENGDDELPEIDYGNLDIMEVKTPNLHGGLTLAGPVNVAGFTDHLEPMTTQKVESLVHVGPYPTFKLIKRTGAVDSDLLCSFYPDTAQSAGGAAFMVYVKMPESAPATIMKFLMNFRDTSGRSIAALIYDGSCYTLQKGQTEWKTVNISSYYFDLPAGFEGYIRFDYRQMHSTSIESGGVPSAYQLSALHIYTPNTTGDPVYIHPPMLVTHFAESKGAAFVNGNKRAAVNLFTGKPVPREDLIAVFKIGDIIKTLPAPTTDKTIHDWDESDVTSTAAKISWDAFDGAASYRVDVFTKVSGTDGLEFHYTDTKTVTETSITLTGLSPNTRYAVMVTALGADGGELAVYDYLNLQTPLEDGTFQPDTDGGDTDGDTNGGETPTGDPMVFVYPLLALILSAGVAVYMLRLRKTASGR